MRQCREAMVVAVIFAPLAGKPGAACHCSIEIERKFSKSRNGARRAVNRNSLSCGKPLIQTLFVVTSLEEWMGRIGKREIPTRDYVTGAIRYALEDRVLREWKLLTAAGCVKLKLLFRWLGHVYLQIADNAH
jgi:hypothetical protein